MAFVKTVESKSNRTKCSCCGEVIPTCSKYSKIEGDNYCHITNCHTYYMPQNHLIEVEVIVDREQEAEIARETFAAYVSSGLSAEAYFRDRDAGYCK